MHRKPRLTLCHTTVARRHTSRVVIVNTCGFEFFDQAFRYNVTLGAPYVMVTNGLAHRVVEVLPDRRWQSLPDIPPFRG